MKNIFVRTSKNDFLFLIKSSYEISFVSYIPKTYNLNKSKLFFA